MAIRKATKVTWTPKGLSDAISGDLGFSGCMSSLSNLVPDPGANDLWLCRPAAIQATAFAGFANPGFISCILAVGNRLYGMISSGRNPGKDEPFAYDIGSNTFIAISGITSANTPSSPPTTGTWVPPVMALVGGKIIVTHQGFNAGAGYNLGVLNINNPAALAWGAGTLTGAITLPANPISVALYSGRAWYAVGNALVFSDTTDPLNCTSGTQVLTLGTNQAIVALAGMPLANVTQGGVVQSLLIFSGAPVVYQITGDPALNNLLLNQMNVPTFTYSQNSICNTPLGTCFVAPDGLRIVTLTGTISDPIGIGGQGVSRLFFFAVNPSRIVLSYAVDTIRVSLPYSYISGSLTSEFYYHLSRKKWSGPHTFPASLMQPVGEAFYMAPVGILGSLWLSRVVPAVSNTYMENGAQLQFKFSTPLLPNVGDMAVHAVIEQTISMGMAGGDTYTFSFLDEDQDVVATKSITGIGSSTIWGQFIWGQAYWGGQSQAYSAIRVDYPEPVVFTQASFVGAGPSSSAVKIGPMSFRAQSLGYVAQRKDS